MILEFNDFNELAIGGQTSGSESCLLQSITEVVVELKSMAVPLIDDGLTIRCRSATPFHKVTRVGAQPHRAALRIYAPLLGQQVYNRVPGLGSELGGIGLLRAVDVAA